MLRVRGYDSGLSSSRKRDLALAICSNYKPQSWNMTVLQPQSLKKKESKHKLPQAHIPACWSLL